MGVLDSPLMASSRNLREHISYSVALISLSIKEAGVLELFNEIKMLSKFQEEKLCFWKH